MPEIKERRADVSLKEYVDARLTDVERARVAAHDAMEKRLDAMNELRDAMKDQGTKFFTRDEHATFAKGIDSDIRTLRDFKATLEGKANQSTVNVSLVIAGIGILLSIISLMKEFLVK
jgi:hypothetical protein